MARRVSIKEKARIIELVRGDASDKEISDTICREFDRHTLDRSTIRAIRKEIPLSPTLNLPTTPTQRRFWERCQAGDHSWMIGFLTTESFSVEILGEDLRGELVIDSWGRAIVIRTCWFCPFTREGEEWAPIEVAVK